MPRSVKATYTSWAEVRRDFDPNSETYRAALRTFKGRRGGCGAADIADLLERVKTKAAQVSAERLRVALIGLALAIAYAPIVGFVVRSILCLLSLI